MWLGEIWSNSLFQIWQVWQKDALNSASIDFFFPPFNLCSSDDLSRNQSCFHAVTSAEAQPRSLKYHRVLMVAHILPESALFSVF